MATSHVFETMGTVVSIVHRAGPIDPAVLSLVEAEFALWDARYSLYRPEAELARIASGELSLLAASEELRETYARANEWRAATGGAFTAHRPDGVIDLSGIVKGLAIAAAAGHLDAADLAGWGINVGGDVLIASADEDGEPWRIGIVDPFERGELLTSVLLTGTRRACATSGTAERGDHIWMSNSEGEFVQATVVADDIITADVLATAIIAGGSATLDLACRAWPIDVITVDSNGAVRMTPGAVRSMRASAEASI